ncbi:MAG: hypothetical protein IT334_08405 [Thermomicrobiales bacterium]|nr:hypothetical protein [Thermomicrobiales bacterium]
MHSSEELTSDSFTVRIDGHQVTIPELFDGFDARDRLGVVVHEPGGAVGASVLILAAITAFYDLQRAHGDDFFVYPDYYVFHIGQQHGNHAMLDIWPGHKEVVVANEPEAVLRAINDRAITHLLVPDGQPGTPKFGRATLASGCLRSAFAYAPNGRAEDADVTAAGNTATEAYVSAVIEKSAQIDPENKARLLEGREQVMETGRPIEHYRRVSLDTARALLATETP